MVIAVTVTDAGFEGAAVVVIVQLAVGVSDVVVTVTGTTFSKMD